MADFKVIWNKKPNTVIGVGGLVLSLSIAFLYGLWLLNI